MRIERQEFIKYKLLLLPAENGMTRELTIDCYGGKYDVTLEEVMVMQDALNALAERRANAPKETS